MDNPWMLTLAAWLGTYLLHSTVLLAATWWILRWCRRLPDHSQETLWRVALFGGFLTATLQLNLGLGVGLFDSVLPTETSVRDPVPELVLGGLALDPVAVPEPAGVDGPGSWLLLVVGLWGGGVVALAVLHALRRLRLRQMLSDRIPVTEGRLHLRFARLTRLAGLPPTTRLTTSVRTRCPMAFGILRPEVCLPASIATDMDFHQQGCVLAHELAHLRASDPLWLLLEAVSSWVGFLQPLNRLGCRRLRELAEYRCDAWAVRHGGSHLHMAHALMTVAESYLAGGEPVPAYAGVNAMALHRSALSRRVERIFADASDSGPVGRSVLLGGVVLGLAAVALAVPGVSLAKLDRASTENPVVLDPADPRLQRLGHLETQLRNLQSDLKAIRDAMAGSLPHPDVLSILFKLEHRARQLQMEQQTLWREAVDAARPKLHPNNRSRR